ncbi:MAG: hypothetical protein CVV06_16785 [Gammaproteobacteria bacterium HGW-Gammaproteobacteria-10]|nr:MAG: hypothetical protein CVV06_16785 [Gammaproteobacteria bacterium HGW-Gammaproteobacteria-10]
MKLLTPDSEYLDFLAGIAKNRPYLRPHFLKKRERRFPHESPRLTVIGKRNLGIRYTGYLCQRAFI